MRAASQHGGTTGIEPDGDLCVAEAVTPLGHGRSSWLCRRCGKLKTSKLIDGEQLTATPNGSTTTVTGARIIPLPTGGDVVRTGGGGDYYFEIPNQNGTNELSLDDTAQNPTWRQFTPYGAPRGTSTTWIDNRGFLNQPTDPDTGLTYDGARDYDPTTGNFISADPILKPSDPQDLNPYDYAEDNPVTNSDPSGAEIYSDPGGGGGTQSCGSGDGGCYNTNGAGGGTSTAGDGTANASDGDQSSGGTPTTNVGPGLIVASANPQLGQYEKAWASYLQSQQGSPLPTTSAGYATTWLEICDLNPGLCSNALKMDLVQNQVRQGLDIHVPVIGVKQTNVVDIAATFLIGGKLVSGLKASKAIGRMGENASEEILQNLTKQGYTYQAQVSFLTQSGEPGRIDFMARDPQGNLFGVETKVNDSPLSDAQAEGYYDLAHGGYITFVGENAEAFGLQLGVPYRFPVSVDHWTFPSVEEGEAP